MAGCRLGNCWLPGNGGRDMTPSIEFDLLQIKIGWWLYVTWWEYSPYSTAPLIYSLLAFITQDADDRQLRYRLMRLWLGLALATGGWGVGGYFWMPPLCLWLYSQGRDISWALTHGWPWINWAIWAAVGIGIWIVLARIVPAAREKARQRWLKKSAAQRETKTDIRTVSDQLPQPTKQYDPQIFFSDGHIFVGLDRAGGPFLIPYSAFRKSHIQLMGTTGAGKGVAAGLLLAQAIRQGEAVIVMDPKNDEWAPHLLRQEAEKNGRPFVLVNLLEERPRVNLIAGADSGQVEELLVAGLGLSDRGDSADHYRVSDRRAARRLAQTVIAANPRATLADLAAAGEANEDMKKEAAGLVGRLAEISESGAICARRGPDLAEVIDQGGVIYIIGSMRHGRVLCVQRMLLVRLMQIVEQRDRINGTPRPVCIFLDELKAHISRPALEMLGAIRDKGAHILLAHQALADLRDCPADLDPQAVVGAVVENCKIRVVYKIQDPEARTWVAEMTGTIIVDDEVRELQSSGALVEQSTGRRTLRQGDRALVDENMLAALPNGVAVIFTDEATEFAHICPIPTEKKPMDVEAVAEHEAPVQAPVAVREVPNVDF